MKQWWEHEKRLGMWGRRGKKERTTYEERATPLKPRATLFRCGRRWDFAGISPRSNDTSFTEFDASFSDASTLWRISWCGTSNVSCVTWALKIYHLRKVGQAGDYTKWADVLRREFRFTTSRWLVPADQSQVTRMVGWWCNVTPVISSVCSTLRFLGVFLDPFASNLRRSVVVHRPEVRFSMGSRACMP